MKILNTVKFDILKIALANQGITTDGLTTDEICAEAAKNGLNTQGIFTLETKATPPTHTPEPTPTSRKPEAAPEAAKPQVQGNDIATAISAAIAAALGTVQQPMDENRIIDLIQEYSPVKTIEIYNHVTKNTQTIDGHTHDVFETCLDHLQMKPFQLYLYGDSGAGKSYTAMQLANALDCEFFEMGALMVKFEALGSLQANSYNPSVVRKWLESDKALLCIDEIDSSNPIVLNQLMTLWQIGGKLTFPDGETFTRTADHFLVVTANTTGNGASAEYNARTILDDAFKLRFVQLEHNYSTTLEDSFADKRTVSYIRKFRSAITKLGLEGATVTPRHTIWAGEIAANDNLDDDKKIKMINNVLKQGLTSSEFDTVLNQVGAY